ncbi:MAG TPA: T3SS effector HopA1 family protein [Opitutaceae bacterium]
MVTLRAQLTRACRGVAAIAAAKKDPGQLPTLVYLATYACGFTGRTEIGRFKDLAFAVFDAGFAEFLQREVSGRRALAGWEVLRVNRKQVHLKYRGIRAKIAKAALGAEPLLKGQSIAVTIPIVLPGVMPGFVFRHGVMGCGARAVSRLYLNITPRQAPWVLGALAEKLDAAAVPFEMKVLGHPAAYLRRDAAVVYVPSETAERAIDLIRSAIDRDGVRLGNGEPLLTRRLATGFGYADDPSDIGGGLSHGQWVTGLLLEAAKASTRPKAMVDAVFDLIGKTGRDVRTPFLRGCKPDPITSAPPR